MPKPKGKNKPKTTHGLSPSAVDRAIYNKTIPRPAPMGIRRPPKLPTSTLTAAFNYLEPSWREYINYARISAKLGNPAMIRFMDVFDHLDQRSQWNITPEEVCDRSAVNVEDLVAEVMRELTKVNKFSGNAITAIAHPKVIAKTVKSALGSSRTAVADRTNFLKATGFIPTPNFSVNNNHLHLGEGSGQGSNGQQERPVLPSHEEEMKQLEAADAIDADEVSGGTPA